MSKTGPLLLSRNPQANSACPAANTFYKLGKQKSNGFWYENGYKILYLQDDKSIKEHVKIIQDHINHSKDDNRLENLQLMTRKEHMSLHRKYEIKNGTFEGFKEKILKKKKTGSTKV